MKLTAQDLKELGIIEQILPEFPVVSSDNMNRVTLYMKRKIAGFLVKYQQMAVKKCRTAVSALPGNVTGKKFIKGISYLP